MHAGVSCHLGSLAHSRTVLGPLKVQHPKLVTECLVHAETRGRHNYMYMYMYSTCIIIAPAAPHT